MEQKHNYQRDLDFILKNIIKEGSRPHLLLHACCAPCSSYCLEYLNRYFKITIYFYNPNISPQEEYEHRVQEIKRFIREMNFENPIEFIEGPYEPELFFQEVRGLEKEKEGGKRCEKCFALRLSKSAEIAAQIGAEYMTTTLTISPLKNAEILNSIVYEEASKLNIKRLPSDFKKKGGYKRSLELSKEHNLYRQNYCGCVFSKAATLHGK